jgi:hypothetical protein
LLWARAAAAARGTLPAAAAARARCRRACFAALTATACAHGAVAARTGAAARPAVAARASPAQRLRRLCARLMQPQRADASAPTPLRQMRCYGRAQDGCTPLHYAAREGHDSVVTLLTERGANVQAKNSVRRATHPRHTRCVRRAAMRTHRRARGDGGGSGGSIRGSAAGGAAAARRRVTTAVVGARCRSGAGHARSCRRSARAAPQQWLLRRANIALPLRVQALRRVPNQAPSFGCARRPRAALALCRLEELTRPRRCRRAACVAMCARRRMATRRCTMPQTAAARPS